MPTKTETKPAEKLPTLAEMKRKAEDYHVPLSEGSLKQMAEDMTPQKAQAFDEYLVKTATGLYPNFAKQLAAGIPTNALLEPYRQVAKQTLGDDTELDFQNDPKASVAPSMTLDEWKGHLKTDPRFGYDKTPQAVSHASQVMDQVMSLIHQPPDGASNGE